MPFLNKLLKPYVAFVITAAVLVLAYVTLYIPFKWSLTAVLFTIAYIALSTFADSISENITYCMDTACAILILFFFGLQPVIIGGVISMFLLRLRLRIKNVVGHYFSIRIFFNIAETIVTSFATFTFISLFPRELNTLPGLLVIIGASILFALLNTILIFLARSFSCGKWQTDGFSFNQLLIEFYVVILSVITVYIFDAKGILLTLALFSIYIPFQRMAHMNYLLKQQNEALIRDTLTQAYNFKHFEKVLQYNIEHDKPFSVIFIDLDKFKEVNDSYGHSAGNKAIVEVAGFIKQCAGDKSILCRFGGDEFCLIIDESELDKTDEIAKKIISQSQKFEVEYEGNRFSIGWSVGVYTISGTKETVQTIIDKADIAMYNAKRVAAQ